MKIGMKKGYSALFLAAVLLLTGCGGTGQSRDKYPEYTSYRDIPGITGEEIAAIESLRARGDGFTYGMTASTEAFYNAEGRIEGYAALFCRWLTELFGISFTPAIYDWDHLLAGMESLDIDFSGEFTASEERREKYYMTGAIAERSIKYMRIEDSLGLAETAKSRPLRYAFLEEAITRDQVARHERHPFEAVSVDNCETAYRLLRDGTIDAFFADGVAEAAFDVYGDVVASDFLPAIYNPVSLATQNPDLAPIVSVVQRVLRNGASYRLSGMYNQGYEDYLRHKFLSRLTAEERDYIRRRTETKSPVPFAAENDNYPVSFYNSRENIWQGTAFDVLAKIEALTGLSFVRANREPLDWPELLNMFERGEAAMITELIRTDEREGRFIWPDASFQTDYYALLSRSEHKNVTINEVLYSRIGLIKDTAFAEVFYAWFPDHPDVIEYETTSEAYAALERGEVELVMSTRNLLLSLTNLWEKPGFKVNLAFKYPYESTFGFNSGEEVLCSIVSKALRLVDTETIVDGWTRRVFDYRVKVAQTRWLIGVAGLLLCLLALLFAMFLWRGQAKTRLEAIVRQRTEDLENQTRLALEASRAKSVFLARMSHEIRTPMNAIIGFSEALLRRELPDDAIENALDIKEAGAILISIINDVLDFSKIEAGKMELAGNEYMFASLIHDVENIIKLRVAEKMLAFNTNIDAGLPNKLRGDVSRTRQILLNLLSNAVKYTNEGSITLSVSGTVREDGSIMLSFEVADTGIGIRQEDMEKLFDSFRRVDLPKNRGIEGTGLGLAISQNLCRLMGGDITVRSVYGKGSVFTALIPQKIVDGRPFRAETEARRPFDGKRKVRFVAPGARILAVDDSKVNLSVLRTLLQPYRIRVDTCLSGEDAVAIVKESPYDLVFMDHMMPGMDGIETARAIREEENGRTVPIIALTANAIAGMRETFLRNDFCDYLSKPIDIEKLDSILSIWIREDLKTEEI
ncbi:MAG: response regulator [Synergistaceae bacterium]|nr:response regulator [Synergistaceae bacterium]